MQHHVHRYALTLPVMTCVIIAACGGPTDPEISPSCAPVLMFDGRLYSPMHPPYEVAESQVGSAVGAVSRHVGCHDTPEEGAPGPGPLQSGDSTLPEGTALHMVIGFPASERLATRDVDGYWTIWTTQIQDS